MQYIQQYFEFALHIFLFPELTDHTLDLEDDFSGDDVSSGVEDGKSIQNSRSLKYLNSL